VEYRTDRQHKVNDLLHIVACWCATAQATPNWQLNPMMMQVIDNIMVALGAHYIQVRKGSMVEYYKSVEEKTSAGATTGAGLRGAVGQCVSKALAKKGTGEGNAY
jgi:hypothetical protein